jgi:Phage tail tube protein
LGTGLNTTFGVALEDEYGVFKEPSKFLEVESVSLARKQNFTESRPLRGRPGIPASRHRETTRWVEGSVEMEVPDQGLGTLLNLLHGETVEVKKEAETKVYKQEHPIGVTAPKEKSLTVQLNKTPVSTDESPFTYLGCKLTQATFSCDTSAQLKLALEVMGADIDTGEELAEAAYADPISSYAFDQAIVKLGGEAIAEGLIIHSFNLVVPIPMKTERWGLGHGAVQLEPVGFNDTMKPTVELSCEFSDLELYEQYVGGEATELEIGFAGAKVEEKTPGIWFTMPSVKFIGEDPSISGPDVLDQTASVEVYDSIEKALATIKYVSLDSAL